jgi:hypothetical protein
LALPRATVTLKGKPARYTLKADSCTVESSFCQSCGSPLYKTSSGFPDFVFFHAATLDDPSQYRPQRA